MNYFFEYFTYVRQKWDWSVVVTQGRVIVLKMGATFDVLRMLGNIDVLKEILANNEMGLLSSFLNSFKKLFGMLVGPNGFLVFRE